MPTSILMPQLGMGMSEGTIARWLVADGVQLARGQPVLEIETYKVTHTIEAPADGVLQQVAFEKETVPVQGIIGYVLAVGEERIQKAHEIGVAGLATSPAAPAAFVSPGAATGEVRASPIARRLAVEAGVDLATITGSGPGGRVIEADVQAAIARAKVKPHPLERRIRQRIPLTGARKVTATRMMQSLASSAQLTITREVDASELVRARQSLLARSTEVGVRVSYDALLAKTLATALTEQPTLNAVVEDEEIVLLAEVHVGVAVASESGLVVPVVRNAESRPLAEVARTIDDLAARARQGKLLLDEMVGGTVTLSNLGAYGVDLFTPILNPPESAVLGVGRIVPRPIGLGEGLFVRPTLQLSLTWDHRVADGVPAALLLARIVELISDRQYLASLA